MTSFSLQKGWYVVMRKKSHNNNKESSYLLYKENYIVLKSIFLLW